MKKQGQDEFVKRGYRKELLHRAKINWELYLFILPALVAVILFNYWPMYGMVMAFQNVKIGVPILQNKFVGWKNFERFFSSPWCLPVIKNTVCISLLSTIATLPIPIILSLLLYNSPSKRLSKAVQNMTYLPHLLSIVLVISVVQLFCNGSSGLINILLGKMGQKGINFFGDPKWVYPMYVISGIWQESGYAAIVYIGALSGVDSQLLEAAQIDGAGKMKRVLYVELPCILPTVATMMILNVGRLFSIGADKMLLLQTNLNLSTSEIISTYVYKVGFDGAQYGFSTAVNLMQNIINLLLVLLVNRITKKLTEVSIF